MYTETEHYKSSSPFLSLEEPLWSLITVCLYLWRTSHWDFLNAPLCLLSLNESEFSLLMFVLFLDHCLFICGVTSLPSLHVVHGSVDLQVQPQEAPRYLLLYMWPGFAQHLGSILSSMAHRPVVSFSCRIQTGFRHHRHGRSFMDMPLSF